MRAGQNLRGRVTKLEAAIRPIANATTPKGFSAVECRKLAAGFLQLAAKVGGQVGEELTAVSNRLKAGEPLQAALDAAGLQAVRMLRALRAKQVGGQ